MTVLQTAQRNQLLLRGITLLSVKNDGLAKGKGEKDFVFKDIAERWRGTRWRSWLRHCATNRNVAGLIPDGVDSTLTEMSTRNLSWGVKAAGA
jgi:hypothetical protein